MCVRSVSWLTRCPNSRYCNMPRHIMCMYTALKAEHPGVPWLCVLCFLFVRVVFLRTSNMANCAMHMYFNAYVGQQKVSRCPLCRKYWLEGFHCIQSCTVVLKYINKAIGTVKGPQFHHVCMAGVIPLPFPVPHLVHLETLWHVHVEEGVVHTVS